ncbi:hypothetical protein evm_003669 [Chilo suppressalis]|nr:hypothetical protein evm_003669 [Chilo suppressalis]
MSRHSRSFCFLNKYEVFLQQKLLSTDIILQYLGYSPSTWQSFETPGHQCSLPADKLCTFKIKCARWRKIILDLITVQTSDARARNLYKSYASLCSEKYRHYMYYPMIIHPFSKLRFWLEMLFVASIVLSYTALAVHYSETYRREDFHDVLLHISDILMLCNIISNYCTGYVEGVTCQRVVLDPLKIFWKYSTTWFLLDLASTASYVPRLFTVKSINLQILLASMKILRIPALYRVFIQFSMEYVAEGSYYPTNPRNCSWIYNARLWNASTFDRFVYSFHRAVGLLRKNSNLTFFQHGCDVEIFIMISWTVGKLLVFHSGLKYFVAVYGVESAACKYYKIKRQVEMYMKQRRLPPRIREKILKFYAIRYQTTFFVEERILPCVSGQLREDIIMHTGRQLIRDLTFMKHLPKKLLLQISFQLKLVIFTAGDIIYKINNIGDCMYFIDKGTVAVYSESGKEICHQEDGDFFGEIALVTKQRLRTTSVVAVSNCELFMLDREDFNNSIACYPTVYEHIKEVAKWRQERTSVIDERHKAEMRNFDKD